GRGHSGVSEDAEAEGVIARKLFAVNDREWFAGAWEVVEGPSGHRLLDLRFDGRLKAHVMILRDEPRWATRAKALAGRHPPSPIRSQGRGEFERATKRAGPLAPLFERNSRSA